MSDTPLVYTSKGNLPRSELTQEIQWVEANIDIKPLKDALKKAILFAKINAKCDEDMSPEQIQLAVLDLVYKVMDKEIDNVIKSVLPSWTKMIETYKKEDEIVKQSAHVFARGGLALNSKANNLN